MIPIKHIIKCGIKVSICNKNARHERNCIRYIHSRQFLIANFMNKRVTNSEKF